MTSEPARGTEPSTDTTPTPQQPRNAPVAVPGAPVKRTRVGQARVAAVLFALILVLLLIFILQNNQSVEISFLGAHGHLPLGVALLFAAILGILLLAIPGTWRIIQLRRTARQQRHLATKAPADPERGTP
jgi:lipopolysaccharide assembly protein A